MRSADFLIIAGPGISLPIGDVCWPSRKDPCIDFRCKVSDLEKEAGEKQHIDTKACYKEDIKTRGVLKLQDLDFGYFYNDSGML